MKICYAITKTRRYNLETKISLVMDDTGSQYLSFASREEARAWIRRLVEGRTNYLERNESIPPTYAITKWEVGAFAMRTSALGAARNGQRRQHEMPALPAAFQTPR